ncbi:MAG: glycosyltransferase family 4 protein [Acidobacteriota bacterium]|nr:glycosyltransferase family 4 protein [Acidobacteriota bacterium]
MKNPIRHPGHIGMLVLNYYPRDIRVRREAEALAEAGFRVDVVCLTDPEVAGARPQRSPEKINGVRVHRLPLSRKRGTSARIVFEYASLIALGIWKLAGIHLRDPFRAIHVHNMPDALVLAGLIPKWTGAKLILDIHDPMSELFLSANAGGRDGMILKAIRWQERWSRRLAHWIITVNEPMRTGIQAKGVAPERILVVHNFTDTRYLPVKDDIARWTPHADRMVWLYAGTINRQYRLTVAVRALKIASTHLPPLTLRLVGEGNDLERIHRLAEDLGVGRKIEYIKPVTIDQMQKHMNEADIGISCHQDGPFGDLQFSVKIIDYLTQGLPVVSSRTKTLERYVPADAVFYFDPDDAEDMAEKIIFLWNHPDIVKQKMENAKKLFPRFTWQSEKSGLIDFYRRILPEAGGKA